MRQRTKYIKNRETYTSIQRVQKVAVHEIKNSQ